MPQVRKNLLRLLAVDETQLPTVLGASWAVQLPGTPPPCSPALALPAPTPALVFQPAGHPKQALIDGELWPPIFQPEAVRYDFLPFPSGYEGRLHFEGSKIT